LEIISYAELLSLWRKGLRNGAFRRLPVIQRALVRAALCYSKIKGRIINPKLVGMIKGIADRIGKSLRQRIFEHGLERAFIMLSGKCYRIFPAIRKWINDDGYILWLGTEIFTNKSVWVL